MDDDLVPLDYLCPVCGEHAVAGRHFCGKSSTEKRAPLRPAKAARRPQGIVPLVAVVMATALWWPWIGPWSLLVLALGAGILLLWWGRRR